MWQKVIFLTIFLATTPFIMTCQRNDEAKEGHQIQANEQKDVAKDESHIQTNERNDVAKEESRIQANEQKDEAKEEGLIQTNEQDADKEKECIRITEPKDGASVPWRPYVRGTVNDANSTVWVIVHPMSVSTFYVQPPITVRDDGRWVVKIYVGRSGLDQGEHFEIVAVSNPKEKLREGLQLKDWPEAQCRSQFIEVTRK